jgi:amidase
MHDPTGAFVPGTAVFLPGASNGPLAGLTFAAKDLFDVAGTVTGCGNPDWAATHAMPDRSAWAVQTLLDAGATLVGKTITDEISLGLLGINRFDGTPLNPRAPNLVAGGSSSGSASAVAAAAVDVALGTDSGGSVRVPASFTGLYGLRPTHGRIPVDGMMTQSPSFDTVGFFARDAATFARVGSVMLAEPVEPAPPVEIIIATDCFAIADAAVRDALRPVLAAIADLGFDVRERALDEDDILDWSRHQRILQGYEFARTFQPWIDAVNPCFSFEVAEALSWGLRIDEADMAAPRAFRQYARSRLEGLLAGGKVLCLPTSPILPIGRNARLSAMNAAVLRIIELTCIAGLTGMPQINLPFGQAGTVPVGLSLIAERGTDAQLIGLARTLEPSFKEAMAA